jgi:hypothetical protein
MSAATSQAQVVINEDFADINNLPGWFRQNNSVPVGLTNWFQGNSTVFPAQAGAPTAYIGANFNNTTGANTISNWLLTPPVMLSNGSTLTFWTRKIASIFPDRLQVRMSTAGTSTNVGTGPTGIGDFTDLLLDINPTYQPDPAYPVVWTQFTITISNVPTPTQGRLAFRYFVENGGPNGANSDYIGIDSVVYTQIIQATTAADGLAVNPPPGNQVLEPNETSVVVAPRWRNSGTVVISNQTGVLSNFTGPAGPTYTINDSTAVYGSIAVGATATCSTGGDCYAVTVNAGSRPQLHWDATALETVNTGNTTKTWTLHVGASFGDVPTTNPFYRFIETLLHRGVTSGCSATDYCPLSNTTRGQMAPFVLVAKEGAGYLPPACTTPVFADVPANNPFCRFVEELARRNVVTGCGGGNYCPNDPVTREQMAIFTLRTLDPLLNPPACTTPMFNDVPANSVFCRWIEELARRQVVTGCGGGNYCPTNPVTREQMGVFLSSTFSLALYGI